MYCVPQFPVIGVVGRIPEDIGYDGLGRIRINHQIALPLTPGQTTILRWSKLRQGTTQVSQDIPGRRWRGLQHSSCIPYHAANAAVAVDAKFFQMAPPKWIGINWLKGGLISVIFIGSPGGADRGN